MAKFYNKKQSVYRQTSLDWDDFRRALLSDVIARLTELQKEHGDEARFNMDCDSDYGSCSGYTSIEMYVSSDRLETDEEFEQRHKEWQEFEKVKREQAKSRRLEREGRERKEWERLNKKFGRK